MMAESDWLNVLYNNSEDELSEEQLRQKHTLQQAMVRHEERTLRWNNTELNSMKTALLKRIAEDGASSNMDSPGQLNRTRGIRSISAWMIRINKYFLPIAVAASVTIITVNLFSTVPQTFNDDASLNDLLIGERIPTGHRLDVLNNSDRRSDELPGSEEAAFTKRLELSVNTPNKTTFSFIKYFHDSDMPYSQKEVDHGHSLSVHVGQNNVKSFNNKLAEYSVELLSEGTIELIIIKTVSP